MLLQYSLTPNNVKRTLVPIKNVFKLSVLVCYFHKRNMLSSRKINTKSMDGDSLLKEAWFNFPILFVESVARWGAVDWNMLDPWDVSLRLACFPEDFFFKFVFMDEDNISKSEKTHLKSFTCAVRYTTGTIYETLVDDILIECLWEDLKYYEYMQVYFYTRNCISGRLYIPFICYLNYHNQAHSTHCQRN